MRIELSTRGFDVTGGLRTYVERRLHSSLKRFGPEIDLVVVRLEGVNGPRGGPDRNCLLTVVGPRIGELTVSEPGSHAFAAVAVAADRARRCARRALERQRGSGAGVAARGLS